MKYETKKVLLTVKAYPDKCKKLGYCVCIAGITDSDELIRLYPVSITQFNKKNSFKKFTWFTVSCERAKEKLNRKESYHINPHSKIEILDSISNDYNSKNATILPLLSKSIEELKEKYSKDKTSLGIIKPELIDFIVEKPNKDEEGIASYTQKNLFGDDIKSIDSIPYIFRYRFKCNDSRCRGHTIMCEDWELLESWRKYEKIYGKDEGIKKIKEKFFDWMKNERDLYFYMGTYSKYPTWLIIGIYYPPKQKNKTLFDDY